MQMRLTCLLRINLATEGGGVIRKEPADATLCISLGFAGKAGESEEDVEVCPSISYSWLGIKERTN